VSAISATLAQQT